MLASVKKEIAASIAAFIREKYDVDAGDIVMEVPPQRKFGDLASPVAFSLAKVLRRAPRKISGEIVAELPDLPHVAEVQLGGAGYINLFLERSHLVAVLDTALRAARFEERPGKIIVEHTNINPNKAAHIGHLRNAVLGDTLVRVLRAVGYSVEVQNYIDDTGVQVADVVVGFMEIEKKTLDEVKAIEDPFDYHCWDLYANVGQWYEQDKSRLEIRLSALHDIEKGDTPAAQMAGYVAKRIVKAHLATTARLGIHYDLLPWESDIIKGAFWQAAFEKLKNSGAIRLEEQGKNKGCWVMTLAGSADFEEMDDPDKILVRSNGTVTYTGKDIAYQLWKFGLLGKDFQYVPFETSTNEAPLWTTTQQEGAPGAPAFGRGSRVYNVIDVRQSYPQKVVKHGVAALGYPEQAEQSIHFAYEMVALSDSAAKALGVEGGGSVVEMSGRKGIGVKADDLLDALLARAAEAVDEEKAQEMSGEERRRTARLVAIAALRYFMIKYGRTQVIAFDFDDALNLRGETGPYLLYSFVRFGSIFRKLEDAGLWDEGSAVDFVADVASDPNAFDGLDIEDWDLIVEVARLEDVLDSALESLELSMIAKFAFNVAQKANSFYHRCHILSEQDPHRQGVLIAVSHVFRQALGRLLDLMGIETLGRM